MKKIMVIFVVGFLMTSQLFAQTVSRKTRVPLVNIMQQMNVVPPAEWPDTPPLGHTKITDFNQGYIGFGISCGQDSNGYVHWTGEMIASGYRFLSAWEPDAIPESCKPYQQARILNLFGGANRIYTTRFMPDGSYIVGGNQYSTFYVFLDGVTYKGK